MPAKKDLYALLGLKRGAKGEEIKKQFYQLTFKYHPDRNGPNFQNKAKQDQFREILEAYQILKNPEKRALYDNSMLQNTNRSEKGNWIRWSRGRYIEPDPLRSNKDEKLNEGGEAYVRSVALVMGLIGYLITIIKELKKNPK
jgi:curved DNA-binding protein CbpA